MKGQTAVFEEVLLFGIAVGIFIASFFVFNYYQELALDTTTEDHMKEMLNYISSVVIDISASEGNVSTIVTIPERINNRYYTIDFNETGITIKTIQRSITVSTNMYGIQESSGLTIKPNTITSISTKIMIYKRGREIGINTINI